MTNVASIFSYGLIVLGFILHAAGMVMIGAILFSVVVVFSIVTLPVEWDASARAKRLMVTAGIVNESERDDAGKVLNAAFLTYVAAVLTSLLMLLYYLLRASGMNNRD
jgi:Zn-dependent membrane protease YugP